MAEVKRFFEDYKALENKQVKVERFMGRFDACNIIGKAIELYEITSFEQSMRDMTQSLVDRPLVRT